MIHTSNLLERMLPAGAMCSSHEPRVVRHGRPNDHKRNPRCKPHRPCRGTNKEPVERLAEVSLKEGTNVLVFNQLHTGIDPSKIRLSGKGDFTVLGMSHRYHTDT